MEFRALGQLEVLHEGQARELGPFKQRSLLALLLVHANEVVSTERILEELWGTEAEGKENALWVYVSRLRSALEPQRAERGESAVLLRRDHGYELSVELADYDVAQFEQLVSDSRELKRSDPGAAAALLTEALDLWRGVAFEEFQYEEFAQNETSRLDEARVAATEDRLEADLARGLAGELVSELEGLRTQYPLRERPVSQLMLALYRSGRPAEALRAFGRFRDAIGEELGIDPSPELRRLEEQILLYDESIQRRPTKGDNARQEPAEVVNPFKGLRPFVEADANDFYGRDTLVAEFLRLLGGGQKLIAVVGASGSGKSSAIRAGLIPALAKGALPGSDEWLISRMVPGSHPFVELEAALLRSTMFAPDSLGEQLQDGDSGLLRAVFRVLPDDDSRMLIVIDQFEELFTLVDDEAVRQRFLSNLVTALDEPHGRVMVVLTLRADFYGRPLNHPEFGARMSGSVVNVTPMSSEELEAAASLPATMAGVSFEPALLGQLIADVGNQPGALPLFQYTLTELFDRRAGDALLAKSYVEMGGVQGSLSRRASDLYAQLEPDEQEAARQLFLRLVTVTDHDERSRRRVEAAEIVALPVDIVVMQEVIGQFGRHRLVSFDADRLTGAPTVEVAHEALLTAWQDLHDWIGDSRDDLRRHASFVVARSEWNLAGHNPDYLLTGSRLDEYEQWERASTITLTSTEREFLAAGLARREAERESEALRKQQETDLSRRARRRLWGAVAAVAALGMIAAFLILGALGNDSAPTVTFFGRPDDDGWNANIDAGVDRAAREFDLIKQNVRQVVDPTEDFREAAESGVDLIITDSVPTFQSPEVFSDFPEVKFVVIDGFVDAPNTASVLFANEQGAFLAGAAAALKSESGTVGFVGGLRFESIERFRAGFEAGARYVDPDIEILATYVEEPVDGVNGYFLDPFARRDLGELRATALYERGADVVFPAAGYSGIGVFDASVRQSDVQGSQLWAIGVDNDQWFGADADQRPHILTSVIKRGDEAAYVVTKQFVEGNFTPGVQEIGMADGAFDFSTSGNGLTASMIERLNAMKSDIAAGLIVVPAVPDGDLLILDSFPEGFEQAFADVPGEQILDYFYGWLLQSYQADSVSKCFAGTMEKCGQFMMDHLDEWLAVSS
jgi:basic membrane lipoprotein Med (substrate-binding protein (PBP1-ABC) superfamily)/DNA-binding SARP family transcriptional activator